MTEHSPHAVAGYLRDHLATHDTPLLFFFGAGTSASISVPDSIPGSKRPLIPAVPALTEACKTDIAALGPAQANAWESLSEECAARGQTPNVENILSRVREKISAMGDSDTSCGLGRDDLGEIEVKIAEAIIRESTPTEDDIPDETPHDVFARWVARTSRISPIEVFTTNYDVLIERALENARVPVFDGFIGSYEPFFSPEVVEDNELMPPSDWVRLWKLHGSVNWGLRQSHGSAKVVRTGNGDPHLILPSQLKYVESRKEPYLALTDRLSKALRRPGAVLVASGFSFADQHLNNIIYDALDANPLTHLVCLAFGALSEYPELHDQAKKRKNIILIARDGAVVSGQSGAWAAADTTTVFAGNTDEADGTGSSNSKAGEMLLGDFNVFARFLSEMDPSINQEP